MELEDAYVTLIEVLEASGPLAEADLEAALRRAGLSDDDIDEVLGYPPEVVAVLPGERWASLPGLLATRHLTHRVSPVEAALDTIVLDVDLLAAAPLFDAGVSMADGTELVVLDPESGFEMLAPRDAEAAGSLPDRELLVLPAGHLAHLGLHADDLLALRFTSAGAVIERVDDAVAVDRVLARQIASRLDDAPTDADELVWALCADDPELLTGPTVPLTELLDALGAARFGSQVAAPGVDLEAWHRRRRVDELIRVHRLRRAEADDVLVLVDHHALLDAIIQGLAVEDVELDDAGRASGVLASPAAAAALLGECAGMGRDGLAALGVLAESMEPRAPRRARASWRWLRAKALERLGDALAAEGELRAALAMEPDHLLVLEDLGRYASDRGDADHALRLLHRAGVPQDEPLVQVLEAHRVPVPSGVGRNDPCWCGSGRKRKHCHRDVAPTLPLEARSTWLVAKTRDYLQQGPHREVILSLAVERARHLGPDGLLHAIGDALVHDVVLLELGAYRDFLVERGPLLPDDERDLLEQWALVERSLFDVEEARAGEGLVLRDVRTGDRHEVRERTASQSLRRGDLICTRVVPAGPEWQLVGGVEPVALHQRDAAIELLDDGDPFELVSFLSARFAPPTLQNTEGEDLVECTTTIRVSDPSALAAELDQRFDRSDDDGSPCWDETVETMGMTRLRSRIRVDGNLATVTANSHARADRTVALVQQLAPGAELLSDERIPYHDLLADEGRPAAPPAGMLDPDDPQVQEVMRQFVRQMEDAWVDESIPALGGVTPRQAAADPTRRDDLLRLLASFDRFPSGPGAMDPARLRLLLDL